MVKVQITRDCAIKGKHYGADDMAEVIEKDADYLRQSEKQWLMTENPNQKWLRRAKNRWTRSLTSERCSTILVCLQH